MIRNYLFVTLITGVVFSHSFAFANQPKVEVSIEQSKSLPVVYLNLALKTGSVSDPKGQQGITNFMGEMLLRGTQSRTKEQIDLELDQMGATLGVETRSEALILRGAVLSSQLDPFLKLVTDIVTRPVFPEHEIRKLKSEVVSQILEELGNDRSLSARRFSRFMFHGHEYGKPVLGTIKDIEQMGRKQIVTHYDALFRDSLMLVVGAGNTTQAKIESWIQEIAKKRPDYAEIRPLAAPSNSGHRRLQIVDKPDRTQVQIYGGLVGVRLTDPDYFPLYLANHAFGGGSFSARMMVEIRVKRGWSYGAYSSFKHGVQPRLWQFHLFPASKDAASALAYAVKMVEDLANQGITQEEFAFAKQSLVNSAGFMYNTPKKRVENRLLEKTLNLPEGFMQTYAEKLSSLTLDEVNLALKEYVKPERLSISVLATAKGMREQLAKAAGVSANQVVVTPYTEEN